MISIDDFKKIEIKIGHILSVEKVPDTDKLLKLSVDFGEGDTRQIISGISAYFPNPQILIGKNCAFVTNLEPRIIKGLESNGMILAVSGLKPSTDNLSDISILQNDERNNFFSLLETSSDVPPGSAIK